MFARAKKIKHGNRWREEKNSSGNDGVIKGGKQIAWAKGRRREKVKEECGSRQKFIAPATIECQKDKHFIIYRKLALSV